MWCVPPRNTTLAHLVAAVLHLPGDLVHLVGHAVGVAVGALDLYLQLVVAPRSADVHVHLETVLVDVAFHVAVVLHLRVEWFSVAFKGVSALVGNLPARRAQVREGVYHAFVLATKTPCIFVNYPF